MLDKTQLAEFKEIASRLRTQLVQMSHRAKTPHLGSSLSCVDLLTAIYHRVLRIDPAHPNDPQRDRFILSKGHAATALYAILAEKKFFSPALLDAFAQPGAALAEQPSPGCAPGVEAATGSLGHGLSIGLGMAMTGRLRGEDFHVYAMLSDGECNEGAVWEAAMFAAAQNLSSVTAIVDYNRWQATGRSDEVMHLAPLAKKWEAFGWNSQEIDGHDFNEIVSALEQAAAEPRPTAIIARTVKGKGVSFMEDDNNWHYRIPTADEFAMAQREIRHLP